MRVCCNKFVFVVILSFPSCPQGIREMAVLMSEKSAFRFSYYITAIVFLAPFEPHGARILESREDDISVG